jgi:competence protein ComEC
MNKTKILLFAAAALAATLPFLGCSDGSNQKSYKNNTENLETIVYVTNTGKKYHSSHCKWLYKSKLPIPLNQARDLYSPCSTCLPPK